MHMSKGTFSLKEDNLPPRNSWNQLGRPNFSHIKQEYQGSLV